MILLSLGKSLLRSKNEIKEIENFELIRMEELASMSK